MTLTSEAKGIFARQFLVTLGEQATTARVRLSLKEQHCLAQYLNVDGDGILKTGFLRSELEKAFRVLDQGQVEALHLLEADDRRYARTFEALKRGLSLSEAPEDLCAALLRVLRTADVAPQLWLDSLGAFLVEEFASLETEPRTRRVFMDAGLFEQFLSQKWGHKLSAKAVGEVLSTLRSSQAHSLHNLDEGLFFGSEKKVSVVDLAAALEVRLRLRQASLLGGLRKCVFAVLLRAQGLSAREYFAQKGVGNLGKKIELFEFHLLAAEHLSFRLEDSDAEFRALDPEQRHRVSFADFVARLEELQSRIPASGASRSPLGNLEANDGSSSRRKIARKSKLTRTHQSKSTAPRKGKCKPGGLAPGARFEEAFSGQKAAQSKDKTEAASPKERKAAAEAGEVRVQDA